MSVNTKKLIANSIGAIGYVFLLIEWLWVLIIIGYPLFSSDFSMVLPTTPSIAEPVNIPLGPLQPVVTFVAIATSILVLLMAAITIATLPKTIAVQSKKTSNAIAKRVIPHVIPKKKQTKKRVIALSTRLTYALKYSAIVIPLFAVIVAPNTTPLSDDITLIVASFFGIIAGVSFFLQGGAAYLLKLPQKNLW